MDTDTIFLVLRVVVALGVVVGVLWVAKRKLAKGGTTRGGAAKAGARKGGMRLSALFGRPAAGSGAALRGRHALSPKSSVAVVEFDGREFLLGVTEQGVTVLHASGGDLAAPAAEQVPEPVAELEAEPDLEPQIHELPFAATASTAPDADWAAMFAREVAAQQAAAEQAAQERQAAEHLVAAQLVADQQLAIQEAARRLLAEREAAAQPAQETAASAEEPPRHEPRYARGRRVAVDLDDDDLDPSLAPEPVPVRYLATGQFVAEVELLPLPTAAIPVVPVADPAPATATHAAAAPAVRPAFGAPAVTSSATAMLPTTAMIPIVAPARPAPAPIRAAAPAPAPAAVVETLAYRPAVAPTPVVWPALARPAVAERAVAEQPAVEQRPEQPEPEPLLVRAAPPMTPSPAASPLAGSILSPDTWRRTVDAIRAMR